MRAAHPPHDSAEAARLRMVENEARLRPVLGVLAVFGAFAAAAALFVLPPRTVAIAACAAVALAVVSTWTQRRLRRSQHPTRWLVAEHLTGTTALAGLLVLTGGLESPLVGLMALATVMAGARFAGRTLWATTAVSGVLLFGGCLIANPRMLLDEPATVYLWIATLVGVTGIATILSHSERAARADAVLDVLTGLLNRKALSRRALELESQARVTGLPVSVVACDLDGFKAINDSAGHDAGDAALQDVAYAMRKALRGFDLIYRVGGDEFIVLLPGAEAPEAVELAERLRAAVDDLDGIAATVTLSLGVATQTDGTFLLSEITAQADEALYGAKRGGRNRVVVAGDDHALHLTA
ncbi:MAG: GGDEF domain-containing protein [Solirubrobacteraceae bacterium]|nr:GGDEF domain-containing protein [Solirubrobacteraceae bacterium]